MTNNSVSVLSCIQHPETSIVAPLRGFTVALNESFTHSMRLVVGLRRGFAGITVAVLAIVMPVSVLGFDIDNYERDSGGGFMALVNPIDDVYGARAFMERSIIGTPVVGNYHLSFFSNHIEDAMYLGLGLTVRLMPHSRIAPFIGVGGSYNHAVINEGDDWNADVTVQVPGGVTVNARTRSRSESYWEGHVETGVRFTPMLSGIYYEVMAQYDWTSGDDADYAVFGLGMGYSF